MASLTLKKVILGISLAVTSTFVLPSAALAGQNCDYPNNDFDGLYCLSKVYQEADKELNTSYKKLFRQLDSHQKAVLKRGQLNWIRERNDSCSRYLDDSFLVNMDCATRMTTNRVNFLNDRLRECNAGSCRTSRLGD